MFHQAAEVLSSALDQDSALDKAQVARSFSRAAATYDGVADFQRRTGENLLQSLPPQLKGKVLDLGCGTGYFSHRLASLECTDQVVGLDIAQGMLAYAKGKRAHTKISWCAGDGESLPLADEQCSLVFSNLTLQWCPDIRGALSEIKRVLRPGGRLLFSTLGPDSLKELRAAWGAVDAYAHVNDFMARDEVLAAAQGLGWSSTHLEEERLELAYGQVKELTNELKALGAHNVNAGQSQGLTGRRAIKRFLKGYEIFRRDDGLLPATYQVFYGVLVKPL